MENIYLPPEVLCSIAGGVHTISTIRNLIESNPIWSDIIPSSIKKISTDPSNPKEFVTFETIRNLRNLEEIEVPIRVNTLGELVGLARLPKLGSYNLQLTFSLFPEFDIRDSWNIKSFLVLVNTFLLVWIRSEKKIQLRNLTLSREPRGWTLERILMSGWDILFRLENRVLHCDWEFTEFQIFNKILNYLSYLDAINSVVPLNSAEPRLIPGILIDSVLYYNELIKLLYIPSITRVSMDSANLRTILNLYFIR
jgi:hypothetical protein